MRPSRATVSPVRLGMRIVAPCASLAIGEMLEDGRAGRPLSVCCVAEAGAGATTLLRLTAADARRRGYIPVAPAALEQWPQLWPAIRACVALANTG